MSSLLKILTPLYHMSLVVLDRLQRLDYCVLSPKGTQTCTPYMYNILQRFEADVCVKAWHFVEGKLRKGLWECF